MTRRGVTLPELLIGFLLLGVLTQASIGPIRRQRDAMILLGVREEIVALFHRARMEARLTGEARLLVEEDADPVLVLDTARPPTRVGLAHRGIHLEIGGSRSSVVLTFGPAGTAEVASATLILRRGEVATSLVVSAYGRVRR